MRKSDKLGAALFFVLALVVFGASQAVLQNLHVTTTNGLWKSLTLNDFINDPGWQPLFATGMISNMLLFPTYAAFSTLFDALSIFEGQRWRQMGVTNALFGALGAGICYLFAYRWTQDRMRATLVSMAYCFSGFFLLHGVINEDIMPSFFFILIATFLAAEWFGAPNKTRIILVGIVFSVGWLMEWRLLFPTLPPLCLALFLSPGGWPQRVGRVALFLAVVLAMPIAISAIASLSGHHSASEILTYATRLLWTGKAVGSGWGGFSEAKFWMLWSAISESIFGGRYLTDGRWMFNPEYRSVYAGLALVFVMFGLGLIYARKQWADPHIRAKVMIFYGVFFAGAVFNAYSQPADPQMQLNIMLVALPGWVLIFAALDRLLGTDDQPSRRMAVHVIGACLVAIPIVFTYSNLLPKRGADARAIAIRTELEQKIDLERTAILYHDFDGTITWWVVKYGGRPPLPIILEADPNNIPDFKWLGLLDRALNFPNLSGAETGQRIVADIHMAMDLGYKIVSPANFWTDYYDGLTIDEFWASQFQTIMGPEKTKEIRTQLIQAFNITPAFETEHSFPYVELTRR